MYLIYFYDLLTLINNNLIFTHPDALFTSWAWRRRVGRKGVVKEISIMKNLKLIKINIPSIKRNKKSLGK